MLESLQEAALNVSDPFTLLMLLIGVILGLVLGVVPGVGGLFGLVMLLPLTYSLDIYAALALLLGLSSVITISDTIPAVLLGIPGSVGAIATVEDGYPLSQQNQAKRALGAAFSASMLGGLFGAVVLGLSIPIMRPLIITLQTPDFLAIATVGMAFVVFISGKDFLKGLSALMLGALLAFVGLDPNTGAERLTLGQHYLWDGVPMTILFMGFYALPELLALSQRKTVADGRRVGATDSIWVGVFDTLREWRLVLQCSSIGAVIGAIPGVGVTVVDWVAYAVAKGRKNGGPDFGNGNIRGVIAPESANNSKEGGYLIPTIALGLPGSITMTILLAAFTIKGIIPGPDMLSKNLSITYSMVMFLALANILGGAICFLTTGLLAKLTHASSNVVFPVALTFVVLGALQTHGKIEDIIVLIFAGVFGIIMRFGSWSRSAFSLGFVLGPTIERYYFLSYQLHGADILYRPSLIVAVVILVGAAVWVMRSGKGSLFNAWKDDAHPYDLLVFMAVLAISAGSIISMSYETMAAVSFPIFVATMMGVLASIMMIRWWTSFPSYRIITDMSVIPAVQMLLLIEMLVFLVFVFGHNIATLVFVAVAVMWRERRPSFRAFVIAGGVAAIVWLVFDATSVGRWPQSYFRFMPS